METMKNNNIETGSIAVRDKKQIARFISQPQFPYLVSFDRTGSHWLRMVMELYFQKPSLVRIFYYKEAGDFTCYHHHDQELTLERENVLYLYRHPVETVYSNLQYENADIHDPVQIRDWATRYGRHLDKWLIRERFTRKKTIITYEGMKQDMHREFREVCRHFSISFESHRLDDALATVTREEVKRKTTHDPQVVNLSGDYEDRRKEFKRIHAALIMDCVYSVNPGLEKWFIPQTR